MDSNDGVDSAQDPSPASVTDSDQQAAYAKFIESLPKKCSPNYCNVFNCQTPQTSKSFRKDFESNKRKFDQCRTPEKSVGFNNLKAINSGKKLASDSIRNVRFVQSPVRSNGVKSEFNWSINQLANLCPQDFTMEETQFKFTNQCTHMNSSTLFFQQDLILPSPNTQTPQMKRRYRVFNTMHPITSLLNCDNRTNELNLQSQPDCFLESKQELNVNKEQTKSLSESLSRCEAADRTSLFAHEPSIRKCRSLESLDVNEPITCPLLCQNQLFRFNHVTNSKESPLDTTTEFHCVSMRSIDNTPSFLVANDHSRQVAHCSGLSRTAMSLNLSAFDGFSPITTRRPVSIDLSPICMTIDRNLELNVNSSIEALNLEKNVDPIRPSSRSSNHSSRPNTPSLSTPTSLDINRFKAFRLIQRGTSTETIKMFTPARSHLKFNRPLITVFERETESHSSNDKHQVVANETESHDLSPVCGQKELLLDIDHDTDSGCHSGKFHGLTSTPNRH